jgi:hypothetical protein
MSTNAQSLLPSQWFCVVPSHYSVMSRAPLLSDFRAHGVKTCALPAQPSELSTLFMLRRIEITECMLPIQLVAQIVSACEELRHFLCEWEAHPSWTGTLPATLPDLYASLLRHSETLKSLHLDLRNEGCLDDLDASQCISTFRPFKCLEALVISENCFRLLLSISSLLEKG